MVSQHWENSERMKFEIGDKTPKGNLKDRFLALNEEHFQYGSKSFGKWKSSYLCFACKEDV